MIACKFNSIAFCTRVSHECTQANVTPEHNIKSAVGKVRQRLGHADITLLSEVTYAASLVTTFPVFHLNIRQWLTEYRQLDLTQLLPQSASITTDWSYVTG